MVDDTVYVRAQVVRWVSDEPIPGIVEVQLIDGSGKVWTFVDKYPMFIATGSLSPTSDYPTPLEIACTVVERNSERVIVSTALPYGIETVDGVSDFTLAPSQILVG